MRFVIKDLCLMNPKSVTLAFKCLFREAGFGELTIPVFWFVRSPSCDLPITFRV
jgi:hypothetical protein